MRSHTALILLAILGLALAGPTKRLEKKSISDYLAPKAAESGDLDGVRRIADEDLMQAVGGENVDRAKKSTTFCVEIRNDQPVAINCDDAQRPSGPPAPVPLSVEPEPAPEPAPAPAPAPAPVPISIQEPCEPEIGAFLVPGPEQLVYAPTGNCLPKGPSSGLYRLPLGTHGLHSGLLHDKHYLHHLHHHGAGVPSVVPLHTQSLVAPIKPFVKPLIHQQLPGSDGVHQVINGVECTCKSSPGLTLAGKSAQPDEQESLAMQFLKDIQKSAEMSQGRYVPVRPISNVQSQVSYQQQANMPSVIPMGSMGGMGGMGVVPMAPMNPMYSGGMFPMMRAMNIPSDLEGSFSTSPLIQGMRLSRGPAEEAEVPKAAEVKEDGVAQPSPSELIGQMKKNDEVSRVARFLVPEKEEESNKLEDA